MKILNIVLFQWFFIRLTKCKSRTVVSFNPHEISLLPDGSMGFGGNVKYEIIEWYSIQLFILPLTGWRNDFVYIGKPKFYRITPKRLVNENK